VLPRGAQQPGIPAAQHTRTPSSHRYGPQRTANTLSPPEGMTISRLLRQAGHRRGSILTARCHTGPIFDNPAFDKSRMEGIEHRDENARASTLIGFDNVWQTADRLYRSASSIESKSVQQRAATDSGTSAYRRSLWNNTPSPVVLFKRTKSAPPTRSVAFANRGSGGEVQCSERYVDEKFGARMQPSSVGLSHHNNDRQNRSRVAIRNVADSVLETDCEPLVTTYSVDTVPQFGVESSFKTPIPFRHNCSSSDTKTGYTERRGMSAGFPHMIATPHDRTLSGMHIAKQAYDFGRKMNEHRQSEIANTEPVAERMSCRHQNESR
jgi:hypothetical protein